MSYDEGRNASKPKQAKHGSIAQQARAIAINHINNPGKYETVVAAARAQGWPKDADDSALHKAHRQMKNALLSQDAPGGAAGSGGRIVTDVHVMSTS